MTSDLSRACPAARTSWRSRCGLTALAGVVVAPRSRSLAHFSERRARPADNRAPLSIVVGDSWVTFLRKTVQNRAISVGTDGINP